MFPDDRHLGQNRSAALDAVAYSYFDLRRIRENHVGPRAELDESDALAAHKRISYFLVKDEPGDEQAGNLLKDHGHAVSLNGHNILLIGIRGSCAHGISELSSLVNHILDNSGNRRPVHVDVKNIKEDADPCARLTFQTGGRN